MNLNQMKISKNCICCGRNLPLFMYPKDRRKFQLPVALGRARCCRICIWKASANGNKVVRYNFQINKFELVILTFKQRLKEFFKL